MQNSRLFLRAIMLAALASLFSVAHAQTGTESVLYRFTGGGDGGEPNGLVLDPKGNLWGTASGGTVFGSIFDLVPGPSGQWSFHLRWVFEGGLEGTYPYGNLAFDGLGNFYGTTCNG